MAQLFDPRKRDRNLIGRHVSVPATYWGEKWARKQYKGGWNEAKVQGNVKSFMKASPKVGDLDLWRCYFPRDRSHELFNEWQVLKWLDSEPDEMDDIVLRVEQLDEELGYALPEDAAQKATVGLDSDNGEEEEGDEGDDDEEEEEEEEEEEDEDEDEDEDEEEEEEEEEEPAPVQKRKRGRPAGSKSKTSTKRAAREAAKAGNVTSDEEEEEADEDDFVDPELQAKSVEDAIEAELADLAGWVVKDAEGWKEADWQQEGIRLVEHAVRREAQLHGEDAKDAKEAKEEAGQRWHGYPPSVAD
eukprot:jgi/Mesvir1/19849/Mv13139-RA.1